MANTVEPNWEILNSWSQSRIDKVISFLNGNPDRFSVGGLFNFSYSPHGHNFWATYRYEPPYYDNIELQESCQIVRETLISYLEYLGLADQVDGYNTSLSTPTPKKPIYLIETNIDLRKFYAS